MARKRSKRKTSKTRQEVHTPPSEEGRAGVVEPPRRQITLVEAINAPGANSVLASTQELAERLPAAYRLPHIEKVIEQTRGVTAISTALNASRAFSLPHAIKRGHDASSPVGLTSARDLGQLIRSERVTRKLSQQEFADLVGVGRRFISELENGKPSLEFDKVLQVAMAAGIDVLARRR